MDAFTDKKNFNVMFYSKRAFITLIFFLFKFKSLKVLLILILIQIDFKSRSTLQEHCYYEHVLKPWHFTIAMNSEMPRSFTFCL